MMDTHVATVLGLPRALRGVDSDQILVNSDTVETLTHDRIELLRSPRILTDTHARLIRILTKAVENNYPAMGVPLTTDGFYAVRYQGIVDIENDLDAW